MPKKAKEKVEELNIVEKIKTTKTKTASKKSSTKNSTKRNVGTKSSSSTKEKSTSKASVKSKAVKKVINKETSPIIVTEYYDLPFRYNQTVVRILAQTPNNLFIYWDISDEDKNAYIQKYGEDFFEKTKPYLIITNETMNYSFEVEINDFANSWYLHINDADCKYKVELGRKFIFNSHDTNIKQNQVDDYLYITSSNEIESPNNHILFDELGSSVFFRNVKTNITEERDISSISFLQKIGTLYNIYDLYKELYNEEIVSDEFGLNLPSSHSSSNFK